jgi:hypothetical protein
VEMYLLPILLEMTLTAKNSRQHRSKIITTGINRLILKNMIESGMKLFGSYCKKLQEEGKFKESKTCQFNYFKFVMYVLILKNEIVSHFK